MPEDFYAGWSKARSDLLSGSVDRVFALLRAARVDDEGWRTEVAAQTFLWRAVGDADAPDVPPRFAEVHRRGGAMLDLLTAVKRRDPDLLLAAMGRLDEAEGAARAVFATALQLTDTPETGGRGPRA